MAWPLGLQEVVSKRTAPDHLSTTLPRLEREDPSLSQQFIKPGSHKQFNQDEKAMIGRRKETDKRETVAQRHKQKQKSNKYSFLIKSITPSHQYNRFGMFNAIERKNNRNLVRRRLARETFYRSTLFLSDISPGLPLSRY